MPKPFVLGSARKLHHRFKSRSNVKLEVGKEEDFEKGRGGSVTPWLPRLRVAEGGSKRNAATCFLTGRYRTPENTITIFV